MKRCDGKKTYEQAVEEVAKKANLTAEDARMGVKPTFEELTNLKFIEWLD